MYFLEIGIFVNYLSRREMGGGNKYACNGMFTKKSFFFGKNFIFYILLLFFWGKIGWLVCARNQIFYAFLFHNSQPSII